MNVQLGMGVGVLWEWGRKNQREGMMRLDGEMGEQRRNWRRCKKSVGVGRGGGVLGSAHGEWVVGEGGRRVSGSAQGAGGLRVRGSVVRKRRPTVSEK
ncbi:hypothetical protein L3X38_009467 [Prunus dulcis]|uniref:Uncharacterized protein n=1 Tax=Prunus dulcis TaxID=3755 RepID=A0AAD4WFV3_PRUDU|nr:hypothetical protein L3X38_009467 [Prunus dulcis]